MRKFFLTFSTTALFVIYILHQKVHPQQTPLVLPPLNINGPAPQATKSSTTAFTDPPSGSNSNPPAASSQANNSTNSSTASPAPNDTTPAPSPAQQQNQQQQQPQQQQTPQQQPTQQQPAASNGQYKDGSYTGSTTDAFYGLVQVKVVIQNGRIADVQFLNYPQDRSTSRMINSQAMPYLTQEAIAAQSANVNIVSGATDTSQAFIQSLTSALSQAI